MNQFTAIRDRGGFTLIEVLVTLVIFSIAMSALLASLYGGARAWRSVKQRQDNDSNIQSALSRIEADIRHAFPAAKDVPPLVEESGVPGGEALHLTSLLPAQSHRMGGGSVWSEVSYNVEQSATGGSMVLVRSSINHIATARMSDAPVQLVLLDGVSTIYFDYLQHGDFVLEWSSDDQLPPAVRITISMISGKTISRTMACPLGALGK
jgi:prepilin-type N-terminal cleavage/methylation domain-containing protein